MVFFVRVRVVKPRCDEGNERRFEVEFHRKEVSPEWVEEDGWMFLVEKIGFFKMETPRETGQEEEAGSLNNEDATQSAATT